jgi:hypothetical protein
MIETTHPQYNYALPAWQVVDDICQGENLYAYLVELNPSDTSDENKERNEQYRKRAIFYEVAGYTVQGMLGTLFTKWPRFNAPDQLQYLSKDATGSGVSIYQLAQGIAKDCIRKGRAGVSVWFPQLDRPISLAEQESGRYVPRIKHHTAQQVINWSTTQDGRLSLVVIKEVMTQLRSYAHHEYTRYREMALDDNGYYFERIHSDETGAMVVSEPVYPRLGNGALLTAIPFVFVGSDDNTPTVDKPPMLPICRVNIGHYNNSADWEDSLHYSGMAQAWMSGITEQAQIDLLKDNNIYAGGPNMMLVPTGGQFGFAAAPAVPAIRQAMIDKIDAMIGLGARFLQVGSAVKTAQQAEGEQLQQHSVLSLIASNVSEALTQALTWCAAYLGLPADEESGFFLPQDFMRTKADSQMVQALVASWMQGALPLSDLVTYLQKNEVIDPAKAIEDVIEELGGTAPVRLPE